MDATAQTGPTPVFGMFHHVGSQRIPFHVAGHLIEVVVIEQTHSADATIQHMEEHSTGSNTRSSRHQNMLRETKQRVNKFRHDIAFLRLEVVHYATSC